MIWHPGNIRQRFLASLLAGLGGLTMLVMAAVPANGACRQALAIGLDISGSVDDVEYRLQLDGLASALLNKDVSQAMLALPDAPVQLFIYEWAGSATQRPLIPWTVVRDTRKLQDIATKLRSTARQADQPATALGQSMIYGVQKLLTRSECWRLTLDLSGDGQSNVGPRPRDVMVPVGRPFFITVNAIVIGTDPISIGEKPEAIDSDLTLLTAYFIAEVIRGPDAFVETAIGFKDFERAMARKLLKELQVLAMGQLSLPAQ